MSIRTMSNIYDSWHGSGSGPDKDSWIKQNQGNYYSDDDYLAEIAQYKDKSWYDTLLNNPWLAGNQASWSPNIWQQLSEAFGDFSARDRYYAELRSQRSQWLANQLEQFRQQEYNEPINQASRELQAGINPDLAGNITPGSASENDQPSTSVGMPTDSTGQSILQVGSSLLGTVFNVLGNLQSLESANVDNKLKRIQLGRNYQDWSTDLIKGGIAEFMNGFDIRDDGSATIEDIMEDGRLMDGLTHSFFSRVKSMPISRHDKKLMASIMDDIIYSKEYDKSGEHVKRFTANYEKLVRDYLSSLHKSRNDYAQSSALKGATSSSNYALKFLGEQVYKPIIDLQLDVQKMQLKVDSDYLNTSELGSSRGNAEVVRNQNTADMLNVKKRIMKAFESINKKILGNHNISPTWKMALQAGVASAEAFSLSKLGF